LPEVAPDGAVVVDVAGDVALVEDAGAEVVDDSTDGSVVADVDVSATGAVVVDDPARLSASEPPEQAVAVNARRSNRTRRFTGPHHRSVP
jgi:hypothetical protein